MRTKALAVAFQAPDAAFEMRSVIPSGDCFYDAMHLQLPPDGRPSELADAGSMRDAVADRIDNEMLALWRMYAEAGVEGYEWLRHHRAPEDLEAVRTFARKRGVNAGAGQCLWADQFALQTISDLAGVQLLIFDEQAAPRGSRSGRSRDGGAAAADPRFVAVGEPSARVAMLHRSRRQHYSPIFLEGAGVVEVANLPPATRRLWPKLGGAAPEESGGSQEAAGDAAGAAAAASSTSNGAGAAAPPASPLQNKRPRDS